MVDPTVSNNSSGPLIACSGLGTADQASCCFANQQAGPVCQAIFSSQELKLFEKGCPSQDCTADCANLTQLYSSTLQEDLGGDGSGPRTRFAACANVPSVARAASDGLLSANISAIAERYISPSAGAEELRKTTAAVTECLSSTCGNARRRDLCFDDYCSPTRLLINNKSPNITAVNNCLSKLCSMGNFNALPYADADVVGIGVFSSYILQCALVVIISIWLLATTLRRSFARPREPVRPALKDRSKKAGDRADSIVFLDNFHKAQCWFMATLMVAALSYGIFNRNLLIVFMLIPLSLNGILPVVLAYLHLVYHRKSVVANGLLTVLTFVLSSVSYWTLYRSTVGINLTDRGYIAYQQFMYKMSAIPACGGYSGLAACPNNLRLGQWQVDHSSRMIHILTPIIWIFAAAVLVVLLTIDACDRKYRGKHRKEQTEPQVQPNSRHGRMWDIGYWVITVVCLAGIGMQLSLLSIALSLNMMDPWDWSFGQIIAITVWLPPLVEHFSSYIRARFIQDDPAAVDQELKPLS